MNKATCLGLIGLITTTVNAAPSLQWSKDISTLVDVSGHNLSSVSNDEFQEFNDGSCALLIPSNSGGTDLLLVLDKDGNKIFDTTNVGKSSSFVGYAGSSARFYVCWWDSTNIVRIFEQDSGTYTHTDLNAINMESETGSGSSLYTISGTTLSKYEFGETQPNIVASISGVDNSNYIISWSSKSGVEYQIQKSTDLEVWISVGNPITGTGETVNWSNVIGDATEFYRVLAP